MSMTDCIIPNRKTDTSGYVPMPFQGRYQGMHRVTWQILNGPIPAGMVIDHTCHNDDADCKGGNSCKHRMCINPSHLQAVTHLQNVQAGKRVLANNVSCKNGHSTIGNVAYRPSGKAYCIACRQQSNLASAARRKARDSN